MATLTVWRFADPATAARVAGALAGLERHDLAGVQDAATVSWPIDRSRPKTRQLAEFSGQGALSGSFWGLLFGLLFFVPLFGMAVGAALGAVSGALVDIGIDDEFIDSVRSEIQPGTSALFMLTSNAVPDKVYAALGDERATLIRTNLDATEEATLREYFAEA